MNIFPAALMAPPGDQHVPVIAVSQPDAWRMGTGTVAGPVVGDKTMAKIVLPMIRRNLATPGRCVWEADGAMTWPAREVAKGTATG